MWDLELGSVSETRGTYLEFIHKKVVRWDPPPPSAWHIPGTLQILVEWKRETFRVRRKEAKDKNVWTHFHQVDGLRGNWKGAVRMEEPTEFNAFETRGGNFKGEDVANNVKRCWAVKLNDVNAQSWIWQWADHHPTWESGFSWGMGQKVGCRCRGVLGPHHPIISNDGKEGVGMMASGSGRIQEEVESLAEF